MEGSPRPQEGRSKRAGDPEGTRLSKTFTSAANISRLVEYWEDPCLRAVFECVSADEGARLSRPIITGVLTIVLSILTPLLLLCFSKVNRYQNVNSIGIDVSLYTQVGHCF